MQLSSLNFSLLHVVQACVHGISQFTKFDCTSWLIYAVRNSHVFRLSVISIPRIPQCFF